MPMRRRVPTLFLLLFFAAFVMLTAGMATADVSTSEARLLWVVRDPEKIEPAAVGDAARGVLRNFRAMIDRAEKRELPLAAPLDLWTMAAGGSVFAARLPVALLVCLLAAAVYRVERRLRAGVRLAAALLVFAAAFVPSISTAPFQHPQAAVIAPYLAARQPQEPAITLFRDDSPLGYYQARYDLRRGMAVDLGWRDFSDAEIGRVVGNLGGEVWLLLEADAQTYARMNAALLETGRKPVWCDGADDGTMIFRYAFADADYFETCTSALEHILFHLSGERE